MTSTDTSYAARTGKALDQLASSTDTQVEVTLGRATAAAPQVAAAPPEERQRWLRSIADALEVPRNVEDLVQVADLETGLGTTRLTNELARSAAQLRFYGEVAAESSYLRATVDHATATTPDLRSMRVPLGPVAVLGASNFPFAFGLLGNDTGAALAAGCPVVAKAHPAHPATSRALAELASRALASAGAPHGAFEVVAGFHAGRSLVESPGVTAVAFTGSLRGGLSLWRLANERNGVIPVYAEMGTINPVLLTSAAGKRAEDIARGFVGSFSLGTGQFCTKPGLVLVPAGRDLPRLLAETLVLSAPGGWLLTEQIAADFRTGVEQLCAAGAEVLATVPGPEHGWSADTTLLTAPADRLRAGSRLLEECFGPVALVVEYADRTDLLAVLEALPGALAGSVMTAGPDDPETAGLVDALAAHAGRVTVDDWPTGVAFTWAQHHGGPWPATTVPWATSVGAAALDRFTRPTTWQSVPDHALPPALREDNPWRLPRRVDGVVTQP